VTFRGFVMCVYELFFTRYVEPELPARDWTDGTF
jgi:hypothetical protein